MKTCMSMPVMCIYSISKVNSWYTCGGFVSIYEHMHTTPGYLIQKVSAKASSMIFSYEQLFSPQSFNQKAWLIWYVCIIWCLRMHVYVYVTWFAFGVLQVDSRLQNPGYIWRVGAFGTCNSSCGAGVQAREVFCASASGPLAGAELCPQADRPRAQQTCVDYSGCSYSWSTSIFTNCSTVCGAGVKQRTVTCVQSTSAQRFVSLVNFSYCSATGSEPPSTEACWELSGCQYAWYTSSWGACSNRCGSGARSRSVSCMRSNNATVDNSLCAPHTKPVASEACSDASECVYQYMDECAVGTHTCSSAATCKDTFGSFECTCNVGYQGTGNTCVDVDECSSRTQGFQTRCTKAESTCFNTQGSFACVCNLGNYAVSDGSCVKCPNGTTTQFSGAMSVSSCSLCATCALKELHQMLALWKGQAASANLDLWGTSQPPMALVYL
jgi:hypothetical protein